MQIGGEYYKTKTGFKNLAVVMPISIVAIFLPWSSNSRMRSSPFGACSCSLRNDRCLPGAVDHG